MDNRLLQMTDCEQKAFKAYNDILKVCQLEFRNNVDMQKMGIKYIRNTITYKCKQLVANGYLEQEYRMTGYFNARMLCYKTLKLEYPLEVFLEHVNSKKRKQVQTRAHKQTVKEEETRLTPGARFISGDDLAQKRIDTSRMDRLARKSPKVYAGIHSYDGL